eukprot:gene12913-14903_t
MRRLSYKPVKPKVVVLGCGWAGFRFAQDIDKNKFSVSLVSPRNHFLFTPLLPSTSVGTLEFRCVEEPVRAISGLHYTQATCDEIDYVHRKVHCTELYNRNNFSMYYDYLVMALGSETNTYDVPGVYDNPRVFFLKQLQHARSIRNKLIESFERASLPSVTKENRERLLTFVVVGGGPTNIEFSSELYDFLAEDVARLYPDLLPHVSVHIIEATGQILGSFHAALVKYVEKLFASRAINMWLNTSVTGVEDGCIAVLDDGTRLPFGLMVWSTGIQQVPLVRNLPAAEFAKGRGGRLLVDDQLRALAGPDVQQDPLLQTECAQLVGGGTVYALGDCACNKFLPLPALAQVAAQQGRYLARTMNENSMYFATASTAMQRGEVQKAAALRRSLNNGTVGDVRPFRYAHLGSMAFVGGWKGVVDTSNLDGAEGKPVKGFLAFLLWRAAYWTKQVSVVNKILIPMYWFKSWVFGRDVSSF